MSIAAPQAGDRAPGTAAVLETDALRVQYGNVVAVNDVTFAVAPGTVTGLIGPNGAGKTTMIDALTGYVRPTSGAVRFQGDTITRARPHRLARPRSDVPVGRAVQRPHGGGEPHRRL